MKTQQMRLLEYDRGKTLETIIREGFESGKNWGDIAADLGVTRVTLRSWARQLRAQVRIQRIVEFGSEHHVRERV